ncbi:pyridoxamine 5'-phosphate oxidase family protein [Algoriphagus sp.]|uniref:pyridoxamine 5'-phosphate oxidase family protein n=1 Tax=Algoriphagus sp. TaxID=1872435 RepID=UPI00391888AA
MLFSENESPLEIWKSISHELHRGALDSKHPFRYINLGTIGKTGPEIRTVVIRSINTNLEFYIFTDFRSEKVAELSANSSATLHFYHPGKRVQIRIKATSEIHYRDDVSTANWLKVQGDAQKAYTSNLPPSTPISDPNQGFEWPENGDDSFFAVLKFIPESIEALQLNGLKHLRILFTKSENWEGQWLVP